MRALPGADVVERLRSNAQLPVCPYDRRSPDYWTTDNEAPCVVCGGLNEPDAPDLCRGADTRVMEEAAEEIERLRAELLRTTGRLRVSIVDQSGHEVGHSHQAMRDLTTVEAFVDDNGTVWLPPTAWAYYALCRVHNAPGTDANPSNNNSTPTHKGVG